MRAGDALVLRDARFARSSACRAVEVLHLALSFRIARSASPEPITADGSGWTRRASHLLLHRQRLWVPGSAARPRNDRGGVGASQPLGQRRPPSTNSVISSRVGPGSPAHCTSIARMEEAQERRPGTQRDASGRVGRRELAARDALRARRARRSRPCARCARAPPASSRSSAASTISCMRWSSV